MAKLSDYSIHAWILENKIKNEKGDLINFTDHPFLFDIYKDNSKNLVVMKGAQIGMTTLEILKNFYDAKRRKMDIIFTQPTDNDVQIFVGGKVNRIIANNPCMLADLQGTDSKDSVEQKKVGPSMIYFRGTWSKKAAISVTADRLVHDEKDSSKLDVISDYQARLQHSKFRETHTFSHPSLPETGVHADWLMSDQKHWFVKCKSCSEWQFLSWDTTNPMKMSISFEKREFVCKKCGAIIDNNTRRNGQWVAKHKNKSWSGYWVSLLIAPWITAGELIDKFQHPDTTEEFFYQKILGLPYAGGTSKLTRQHLIQNLTYELYAPTAQERVVMGIDTGLKLDYVLGNQNGLFYHAEANDYDELDRLMARWPKMIAVIDQGGDLIGSRKFFEKWTGRVFLCGLTGDRKTKELIRWGKGEEYGSVMVDRNRMIQLVVDEFRDKRIKVNGSESEWYEYWLDWNNLAKMKVIDSQTNEVKGYKWIRNGRDHKALATVFWRVGMSRFNEDGMIIMEDNEIKPNSYIISPDNTVELFNQPGIYQNNDDWRI